METYHLTMEVGGMETVRCWFLDRQKQGLNLVGHQLIQHSKNDFDAWAWQNSKNFITHWGLDS